MNEDIVYRSKVKSERVCGPIRNAWLPAKDDAVTFGVHYEIA